MNEPIISFNSGELSPLIDARSDFEKYAAGCRLCRNMIPRVYGVAERRPGFQYIYGAYSNSVASRLIPFIYSNAIAYVVEMSNLKNQYYYDGAIVLDGASPVQTTTPYATADLFEIQYAQSNDVMWLVHGDYAPRLLERASATSFTLTQITFDDGPFLQRNDILNDDSITITPSATTGNGISLTASSSTFDSDHVGALFKLTQPRNTTSTSGTATGTGTIGSAIDVDGPFTFTTGGHWGATVELQRNEDSNGWETYKTWVSTYSNGAGSLNAQYSGTEYAKNVQYRIQVTAYTAGTVQATLAVNSSTASGIARVTAFTSATVVTANVVTDFQSTNATLQWYEGAWSAYRGYPKSVTFFEDRCVYAGTAHQPQTIWFSESGLYHVLK